jgi:hypothetical protein
VIGYEASRWVPDGQKRIQQIEQRIDRIKRALLEIGPMRPGSLTRQYKDPEHQAGAYWEYRALTADHDDCGTWGRQIGWKSVLSSKEE